MTWFDWALVSFWAVNALGTVLLIGRHREPVTPGVALGVIVVNALLVAGLVTYG